jgi:hypothetical protein
MIELVPLEPLCACGQSLLSAAAASRPAAPPKKKNTTAFTIFPAMVARVVKAPLAKKVHHTRRCMRVVYTGDSQRNVCFTFLNVVDGGVVDLGVFHSQQQAALKRDRCWVQGLQGLDLWQQAGWG